MNNYKNSKDTQYPDELIKHIRKDELLIFCGAGVSVDAGLPTYENLLKDISKEFPEAKKTESYKKHFKNKQYDKAVSYLKTSKEDGFFNNKERIENKITDVLSKDPKHLTRHTTLLEIAKSTSKYQHKIRLVTTNFDALFEKAIKAMGLQPKQDINIFKAPLIPTIAAPNRWDGLIKIHGCLDDLDNIVISSGDFGRAYLTEGFARRFIVDMLKHFHVLFVGYSVGDPIMRYIIDACYDYSTRHIKQPYIMISEKDKDSFDGLDIKVIGYEDYDVMWNMLAQLERRVKILHQEDYVVKDEIKKIKFDFNELNCELLLDYFKTRAEVSYIYFFDDSKDVNKLEWLEYFLKTKNKEIIPIIHDDEKCKNNLTKEPISDSSSVEKIYTQRSSCVANWLKDLEPQELLDFILEEKSGNIPNALRNVLKDKINNINLPILNILLIPNILYDHRRDIDDSIYIRNIIKNSNELSPTLRTVILNSLKPAIKISNSKSEDLANVVSYEVLNSTLNWIDDDLMQGFQSCSEIITQDLIILYKEYVELCNVLEVSKDSNRIIKNLFDLVSKCLQQILLIDSELGILYIKTIINDYKKSDSYTKLNKYEDLVTNSNLYKYEDIICLIFDVLKDCNNTQITSNDKIELIWDFRKIWLYDYKIRELIQAVWKDLDSQKKNEIWQTVIKDAALKIDQWCIFRFISWINEKNEIPLHIKNLAIEIGGKCYKYLDYDKTSDDFNTFYISKPSYGYRYKNIIFYDEFVEKTPISQHIHWLDCFKATEARWNERENNIDELWNQLVNKNPKAALSIIIDIKKEEKIFALPWNALLYNNDLYDQENAAKEYPSYNTLLENLFELSDDNLGVITNAVVYCLGKIDATDSVNKELFLQLLCKILKLIPKYEDDIEDLRYYDINNNLISLTTTLITCMCKTSNGIFSQESLSYSEYFSLLLNRRDKEYAQAVLAYDFYKMSVLLPEWTRDNILPILDWNNSKQAKCLTAKYWEAYLSKPYINTGFLDDIKKQILLALDNIKDFTELKKPIANILMLLFTESADGKTTGVIKLSDFVTHIDSSMFQYAIQEFHNILLKSTDKKGKFKALYKKFKDFLKESNNDNCTIMKIKIFIHLVQNNMIEVKEWGDFWVQQITRSITSQKLDSYPPYLYEIREIFDNINLNKFDCKWIEIIIECLSIILANQRHELSKFLLKLKEPCKEITLSESAETSYKNLLASSYSSF